MAITRPSSSYPTEIILKRYTYHYLMWDGVCSVDFSIWSNATWSDTRYLVQIVGNNVSIIHAHTTNNGYCCLSTSPIFQFYLQSFIWIFDLNFLNRQKMLLRFYWAVHLWESFTQTCSNLWTNEWTNEPNCKLCYSLHRNFHRAPDHDFMRMVGFYGRIKWIPTSLFLPHSRVVVRGQ